MQTVYNTHPAIARAGMLATSSFIKDVWSRLAVGAVKAGFGVFRVPGYGTPGSRTSEPGQVYQNPSPAVAVSATAILASGGVSSVAQETWSGAELNGAVGTSEMFPARRVTVVLSNHADWDATTAVLSGVNMDGFTVSENLSIPNGGNTTLTSVNYYRSVTSLVIPIQSGAGGTFTMGITVLDTVTAADFVGVAMYDAAKEPDSATAEFGTGDAIPVLAKGPIYVNTEDACTEGGDVFVRVASGAGGSQMGAFRSDADTASAVQLTGAKWGKDSAASGLNYVVLP